MGRFVKDGQIAGAVTIIATANRVVQLEAVGKANIAHETTMETDAIFWIASMTKPVTATAVLMLQDEGKLSIDDPVAKYLPELAELKGSDGQPARVTLKHLLTHTSGMVSEAPPEVTQRATCLADLIPEYAKHPLAFEPGSKWVYCQSAINSLGRVVEVVSGKSAPEFFQERIFGPLGMKDTTFYLPNAQTERLAANYSLGRDGLREIPDHLVHGKSATSRARYPACNGGLASTASDYCRFCQMLLNDGSLNGRRYLKPETVRLMRTIQTGELKTGFTPGNGWGLGVCVVREPQGVTAMLSPGTFGHGGAFGTQAWIDPVRGVILILMIQRADFPNSDKCPVREEFQRAAMRAMAP